MDRNTTSLEKLLPKKFLVLYIDSYLYFFSLYYPLAEMTPECIRVEILSFSGEKDKKFNAKDLIGFYKRVMAQGDARMMQRDFSCGQYLILDCRGIYSSHLTELPWMLVQKFTALVQVYTNNFLIIIKSINYSLLNKF